MWTDGEINEADAGALHTGFALNSVSGSVVLARSHYGNPVIVDYLDYHQVGADGSYGSFPEGDPHSRRIFPTATPGSANTLASPQAPIIINERMSDNATVLLDGSDNSYDDWLELYNTSASAVNLGGYFLTDDLSDTNKFAIPGGTIIPGKGFLIVWADEDTQDNGPGMDSHANFRLSRNGEEIGLYAPDGLRLDAVVFGPQAQDTSEGVWPDGATAIYAMSPPTPGAVNSILVGFRIDTAAVSGTVYRVETIHDLLGTNWFLYDIITANNAQLTFTDTNAVSIPATFYRLVEQL